jgi:CRISPR-associated protein Csb2
MARIFALTIHLHDRRYHGTDEWPPAPARVYQALVAGAALGRHIPDEAVRALKMLEGLAAPVIAVPAARRGQRVSTFVPNNDLDAVGGDPNRVGEVRTKKTMQPHLLEDDAAFLYAWSLPETGGDDLVGLADGLYQMGRGIDPAWAVGELLDDEQLAARLRSHRGTIHRPMPGDGSTELAVPTTSSFQSIVRRFEAALLRLRPAGDGRTTFVQAPKAHFAMVRYGGTPPFHLFELRRESEPARLSPWVTWRAASLVEHVRDMALAALSSAVPERKADIERVLVGRKRDGTNAGPIAERVRILPLPSIGHAHADQSIRRVIVQVPPGALTENDVLWALAGRPFFDPGTGEVVDTTLAAAPEDDMVRRYCASSRTWRSVTPLALGLALRRRIGHGCQHEEAKPATERGAEEGRARHAVAQALRHAGFDCSLVRAHVQREPFEPRGTRAERFAEGTRFAKEALWHVEIELDREIRGPLVLGDGRFLGLGVMAPKIERGVFAIDIERDLHANEDTTLLARALRRAVMARVQATLRERGERELPSYFHGHARSGGPLKGDRSTHLAFSVDVARSRLLIVPPHVLDGRNRPSPGAAVHLETLERALEGFTTLRAGSAGVLSVQASSLAPSDPLRRSARVFQSLSDYVVSRHAKQSSVEEMVVVDVRRECDRRKLPRPDDVRITSVRGVPGFGVVARVLLTFPVAVHGPLLLGRTRYLGGGLFGPVQDPRSTTL